MNPTSENPYIMGINRVQDYIENHLDKTLTVKELADIAAFSQYHFLRIYGLLTGETLYAFIKRLRLEKAAFLLSSRRDRSITDIALSVGFSNQASFAKAFKQKFGISGREYRNKNKSVEEVRFTGYSHEEIDMNIQPVDIQIRTEKARKLIYLRYTGPYKGDSDLFSEMFQKLYQWANERDLVSRNSRWFVIYHDLGLETDEDQLRLSVCMSVDRNVALNGEIGLLELKEGKYGVGRFHVNPSEYGKAWYYMFANWLPGSGFKPDETFALEHYPPAELSPEGKRLVEIYIPIVKS